MEKWFSYTTLEFLSVLFNVVLEARLLKDYDESLYEFSDEEIDILWGWLLYWIYNLSIQLINKDKQKLPPFLIIDKTWKIYIDNSKLDSNFQIIEKVLSEIFYKNTLRLNKSRFSFSKIFWRN